MKRNELYVRSFRTFESPGEPEIDRTERFLEANCISIDAITGSYFWYGENVVVKIDTNKRILPREKKLERWIYLKIMPMDASLPDDLRRFLEREKFDKIEGDYQSRWDKAREPPMVI